MRDKLTYKSNWLVIFAMGMLLFGLNHSCMFNETWNEHFESEPEQVGLNVLEMIALDENYSLFYEKLLDYGFDKLLSRSQYFTVFIPANAAFDGLPQFTDDQWKQIIDFHILYSKLFSQDFSDINLLTRAGKYLKLEKVDTNQFAIFNAWINMDKVDMYCKNGVLHEIGQLLIPKPNVYEYIMNLDDSYSILQDFLASMDSRFIDYDNSERIGVDDQGNTIYDTVWREENYFLDNIAGLNREEEAFTAFIPSNEDVLDALDEVSTYFGNINELDEETYNQLLFITFSGSFSKKAYSVDDLPDTIYSVTDKSIDIGMLTFAETDVEVSNGMVHLLGDMTIPREYFLLPITIECDRKENRTVSNTVYPVEVLSDTRASRGSYVSYGCKFVGDYMEFKVDMVLKTTYWFVWTGPKQGPSHYQLSVREDVSGEFVNVGPPVDNWAKGSFQLVVSGTYTFNDFGTKTVRMTVANELPLVGYNSLFLDYIKLVPDEIYTK
ncbi:MAG: fasciclin domain-containing protein [Bacteroidales bacterium]|nr:fasciclin domain-containing protein [Bacteroidales bacterium]